MNQGLEFDWAGPGDLAELEAFHADHFGADSVQALPGRVRWLYFDHPLGLHVAVCRDSGRLVASCGHLAQVVPVAGAPVTAGFGIDFMVAPSHRRLGIGKRFLEMRLERFPLSLSTGQSPEMRALYAACGGVELGPLFLGLHRRRPPGRGGAKALALGWAVWAAGMGGRRVGAVPGLREVPCAEAAELAACGDDSGDWLRWRFGGPVYADHVCLAAEAGFGSRATVFCREQSGVRQVVGVAGAGGDRAAMLAAVARRSSAEETRVMGAGADLHGQLRRAGYLVRPTGAQLVAMTLDSALRRALRPGAVELDASAADADLLRRQG